MQKLVLTLTNHEEHVGTFVSTYAFEHESVEAAQAELLDKFIAWEQHKRFLAFRQAIPHSHDDYVLFGGHTFCYFDFTRNAGEPTYAAEYEIPDIKTLDEWFTAHQGTDTAIRHPYA